VPQVLLEQQAQQDLQVLLVPQAQQVPPEPQARQVKRELLEQQELRVQLEQLVLLAPPVLPERRALLVSDMMVLLQ